MFGVNLECGIKSVKVRVKDVDGRLIRRCRVVLSHEFTEDIAKALGSDARSVRDGLRSGGIEKATMPIGLISAMGVFSGPDGEAIEIGTMSGVKATGLAPKDSDAGATIQLEFDFAWQEDAWLFLGRHCSAIASVVLTQNQLDMSTAADATVN